MSDYVIPKVINYCWFGEKELPREVKKCIKTWERQCPDFKIVRWDESNVDLKKCKFIEQAYKNKAWAFVSDYVRLQVIYENGGIYLDTDVEVLQNLTPLLKHNAYFGIEQKTRLINTGIGFGARKEHPLLKELIDIYEQIEFNSEEKNELACPLLNAKVFSMHGYKYIDEVVEYDDFFVYPPKYFDPYAPGTSEYLVSNETFSIHHYTASWKPMKSQL